MREKNILVPQIQPLPWKVPDTLLRNSKIKTTTFLLVQFTNKNVEREVEHSRTCLFHACSHSYINLFHLFCLQRFISLRVALITCAFCSVQFAHFPSCDSFSNKSVILGCYHLIFNGGRWNLRFPGWDQPTSEPHHQHVLQQQGDFLARTHQQLFWCKPLQSFTLGFRIFIEWMKSHQLCVINLWITCSEWTLYRLYFVVLTLLVLFSFSD